VCKRSSSAAIYMHGGCLPFFSIYILQPGHGLQPCLVLFRQWLNLDSLACCCDETYIEKSGIIVKLFIRLHGTALMFVSQNSVNIYIILYTTDSSIVYIYERTRSQVMNLL
jgi:hypothetical protein